jgi:uncharacterized protein DUF4440
MTPRPVVDDHHGMDDGTIEPTRLEERGWDALSAPGAGPEFYREVLDGEVVMLLPGGLFLDNREAIIESMGGPPWSTYRLENVREHRPTPDTAIVTYGVVAQRGDVEYSALIGSLYVRREQGWRMAFHQQTPR